jgi:hypothetical protein
MNLQLLRTLSNLLLCLGLAQAVVAQPQSTTTPIPRNGFEISLWAREPMLKNPVALSFDDRSRLYVVETARRSTVDIDIRGHPSWIVDDLSNQSIDDLRRFFRRRMSPEKSAENANWLRDYNGDGSHDWRDLMEVKERVHLLEDTQDAGKADRAHVFAEGSMKKSAVSLPASCPGRTMCSSRSILISGACATPMATELPTARNRCFVVSVSMPHSTGMICTG